MRQLLSKLLAGGLSAAVVLLWYPQFFPSDSVESWLIRGVVWTLSFELLLLAFSPFEESLWETRVGQRLRSRASRVQPEAGHLRGRSLLAGGALLIPIALLAFAPPQVLVDKSDGPTVQHVTEVKRIVKVQRIAAAPDRTPASASATPATTATPSYEGDRAAARHTTRATTSKPSKTTSSDESTSETPVSETTDEAPATADAPAATEQQHDAGGSGADRSETPVSVNPRLLSPS